MNVDMFGDVISATVSMFWPWTACMLVHVSFYGWVSDGHESTTKSENVLMSNVAFSQHKCEQSMLELIFVRLNLYFLSWINSKTLLNKVYTTSVSYLWVSPRGRQHRPGCPHYCCVCTVEYQTHWMVCGSGMVTAHHSENAVYSGLDEDDSHQLLKYRIRHCSPVYHHR